MGQALSQPLMYPAAYWRVATATAASQLTWSHVGMFVRVGTTLGRLVEINGDNEVVLSVMSRSGTSIITMPPGAHVDLVLPVVALGFDTSPKSVADIRAMVGTYGEHGDTVDTVATDPTGRPMLVSVNVGTSTITMCLGDVLVYFPTLPQFRSMTASDFAALVIAD